jgi:hypothetical protein
LTLDAVGWDASNLPDQDGGYTKLEEAYREARTKAINGFGHLVRGIEREVAFQGLEDLRDAGSADADAEIQRFLRGDTLPIPDADGFSYPPVWYPKEVAHPSIATQSEAAYSLLPTEKSMSVVSDELRRLMDPYDDDDSQDSERSGGSIIASQDNPAKDEGLATIYEGTDEDADKGANKDSEDGEDGEGGEDGDGWDFQIHRV